MSQALAFVFPGQGSQQVGMLQELAEQYGVVKTTFDQASDVLDYDLWQLVQEGPAESLNQTDRTQPALLTSSVAIWRVWNELGGAKPALMAGHSLGEYSALACAESIDFADAVRLVKLRGEYMQAAVPEGTGAMAAIIGLEDAAIEEACAKAAENEVVSPVNYNSPGQVVIAGNKAAVERAIELCKAAGAKRAMPLPVSVPSHCELMQPAAEKLAAELARTEIKVPGIPVVQNVDARPASTVESIRDKLVRQLYSPVQWVDSVNYLAEQGVQTFLECGPGKVLCGLNKRIQRRLQAAPLHDVAGLQAMLAELSAEND